MSPNRERILAAFTSLRRLFCDLGMFADGDAREGVFVRYWGNGAPRTIAHYRDHVHEGLVASFHPRGEPFLYQMFKQGQAFGEAIYLSSAGRVMKHVLAKNGVEFPFEDFRTSEFQGYLLGERDLELDRFCRRLPKSMLVREY